MVPDIDIHAAHTVADLVNVPDLRAAEIQGVDVIVAELKFVNKLQRDHALSGMVIQFRYQHTLHPLWLGQDVKKAVVDVQGISKEFNACLTQLIETAVIGDDAGELCLPCVAFLQDELHEIQYRQNIHRGGQDDMGGFVFLKCLCISKSDKSNTVRGKVVRKEVPGGRR